ncbi:MAG: glycosyltransferase family 2 protein [Alphaproteobacteria bacterium]|nr:glycosyltransferase family 2 protein [Alphaproteobacteria bacterium]
MSTSTRLPISVFIIALNEADRIGATIESVRGWVDEVIVIDSGSDDDTVKVAEKLGARVLYNAWPGYGLQKRFGEERCRNDWVLNLDADEVVSSALKEEIIAGLPGTSHAGFMMNIAEILPGRSEPGAGAHVTRAVRLYRKSCGRYSDSTVHDRVHMTSGTIGELANIVEHRSSRGLTHSLDKINRYSTMQANDMAKKGLKFAYLRLATEFPLAFLKAYLLRGYILKGAQGFTNAMVYGFSRFIRIAKYLEQNKRG